MLDLQSYLDRLASVAPTPGGGSAATIVGALGAGLIAMVARITLSGAQHMAVHADAAKLVAHADLLRAQFVAARPTDEAAYDAVICAQALPRASVEERALRTACLQTALAGAAAVPLQTAAFAVELTDLCERAARLGNAHLMSDVACALHFARATLDASATNVHINLRFLKDAQLVNEQAQRLGDFEASARSFSAAAMEIIARADPPRPPMAGTI